MAWRHVAATTHFTVIVLRQVAIQRVAQHLARFGVLKVHGQSRKVVLEMMLRWISLEPPKIVSLRRFR
ncbi:hypothetical protein D3C71_1991350 [compost metagenome]